MRLFALPLPARKPDPGAIFPSGILAAELRHAWLFNDHVGAGAAEPLRACWPFHPGLGSSNANVLWVPTPWGDLAIQGNTNLKYAISNHRLKLTGSLTLACRMKISGSGTIIAAVNGSDVGWYGYVGAITTGKLGFYSSGAGAWKESTSTTYSNGAWHSAAFAYDAGAGSVTFYLDGAADGTSSVSAGPGDPGFLSGAPPYLFATSGGTAHPTSPIFDYLYVWGRALSAAELRLIHFDPFAWLSPTPVLGGKAVASAAILGGPDASRWLGGKGLW